MFGDVTSANIVGYNNYSPAANSKTATGVSFVNVDGSDIDIQSLTPYLNGAAAESGAFTITYFNPANLALVTVSWTAAGKYWNDPEDYGDKTKTATVPGWATSGKIKVVKTFAPGEMLLFQTPTSGTPGLMASGALLSTMTDSTKELNIVSYVANTKVATGNPIPADVDIQSIKPYLNGAAAESGAFTITYFNPDNLALVTVSWTAAGKYWNEPEDYGDKTKTATVPGWATSGKIKVNKTFALSEGFLLQTPSSGTPGLAFPNPFYKAN